MEGLSHVFMFFPPCLHRISLKFLKKISSFKDANFLKFFFFYIMQILNFPHLF